MNYLKQNLVALLITGLMIGSAQAGIKVEVDCCNLVQPALKSLSNVVDALSRVRVPTISYVNPTAHTITTVYKGLRPLAFGTCFALLSGTFAYVAAKYQYSPGRCANNCVCYTDKERTTIALKIIAFKSVSVALSGIYAVFSGMCFFSPDEFAQTVTECIG